MKNEKLQFKIKNCATPKRSLGQNFLTSVGAVEKIVAASDDYTGLTILEVGPGRGVLTEALLKKFKKVLAVEKDESLGGLLEEKFTTEIKTGRLKIVFGDILKLNPTSLKLDDYAIVANIPYYITGQFLRNWLSTSPQPKYMVLMLQKEVAQRIIANSTGSGQTKESKESLLSISVKVYGEPHYIETIKSGSFFPAPKVDSAILKIDNISKNFFTKHHLETKFPSYLAKREEAFFSLVKAGFAHKRKVLLSNLKAAKLLGNLVSKLEVSKLKEDLQSVFATCHIDLKARAEDLTVENWRCLAD